MDPLTYIETETDLQAAQFREWAGREYARSLSKSYPIPPDPPWPGSSETPPAAPPIVSYTLWWCDPFPKVGGGAVFKLDDDLVSWGTQAQTLSDGHEYFCDLSTAALTHEQLSEAGKAAVEPPVIEM